LAACYSELKEYSLARDALLRVQNLEERENGSEHVLVGLNCKMLVETYLALGEFENARSSCKRAQAILRHSLPNGHRVLLDLDKYSKRLRHMHRDKR
jgi:hypothetical protein